MALRGLQVVKNYNLLQLLRNLIRYEPKFKNLHVALLNDKLSIVLNLRAAYKFKKGVMLKKIFSEIDLFCN